MRTGNVYAPGITRTGVNMSKDTNVFELANENCKRTIYRVIKNKDNPYVQINKTALHDRNLSWKAKGLHSYMLSMPDDWKFIKEDIVRKATDGMDSLKSAIKELERNGYVSVAEQRNPNGTFACWETNVYETPQLNPYYSPPPPLREKQPVDKSIRQKYGKQGKNRFSFRDTKTASISGFSASGLPNGGQPRTTNNNITNNKTTNTVCFLVKSLEISTLGGNSMIDLLIKQGFTKPEAEELIKQHTEERCLKMVKYANNYASGVRNRRPFILRGLRENWSLSIEKPPSRTDISTGYPIPSPEETLSQQKPIQKSRHQPKEFIDLLMRLNPSRAMAS